jgi:hypothetical protein
MDSTASDLFSPSITNSGYTRSPALRADSDVRLRSAALRRVRRSRVEGNLVRVNSLIRMSTWHNAWIFHGFQ